MTYRLVSHDLRHMVRARRRVGQCSDYDALFRALAHEEHLLRRAQRRAQQCDQNATTRRMAKGVA